MRIKKRTPDYGAMSRQSIKRDFQKQNYPEKIRVPEVEETPQENTEVRIIHISEKCQYAKYARFLCGKLMRVKEPKLGGTGWYEFVFDEDRKALNTAAGWSDNKTRYFLERPKFKN